MKISRVRPKKNVCGLNLLGLFCGWGSFRLMPTSVAWGESSSHPLLSCRVFDAGQVEGCVVAPPTPQLRARTVYSKWFADSSVDQSRWSSTSQLHHRQQVSPGTRQAASRRVQAHGQELRPSRVARDSVVNYNDNASSGGIGARYVVTGYSKSKRSRWGRAPAEQLSVRQPTVTETRCGKLEG